MAEYLTEMAYNRWLRQYQVNLQNYIRQLYALRIQFEALSEEGKQGADALLTEKIDQILYDIDENFEKAYPRDFSLGAEPLTGSEKFVENSKVLINLLRKLFKANMPFESIYQKEKDKIQKVYNECKFNEKLRQVQEVIEKLESSQSKISANRREVEART